MISRLKAAFDAAGMGLDFLLFGNGHGLAAPYFPERFIWIGGRFYTWIGGHGAQMVSREWRAPPPQERRTIAGRQFMPFQTRRCGPRVEVSWTMADLPRDLNAANASIRALERDLAKSDILWPTAAASA
jgi:hypothetical protein